MHSSNDPLGDPEKLPKEIVLKRAADLAEALYSMPRFVFCIVLFKTHFDAIKSKRKNSKAYQGWFCVEFYLEHIW